MTSSQKKRAMRVAKLMESYSKDKVHYTTWLKSINAKFKKLELQRENSRKGAKK